MEIQQLKYFVTVAKHMNVTKAAQELNISQPSLSSSIIRLESELGNPLFSREKKRLALTPYGGYFFKIATNVLSQIALSKTVPSQAGKAQINIVLQVYSGIIIDLIHDFELDYPQVQFNVSCRTMVTTMPVEPFDFIVCNSDLLKEPPRNYITIDRRTNYVVLPHDHPLTRSKHITMEDIASYADSYCFIKDEHGDLELAYYALANFLPQPNVVFTTDNPICKNGFLSRGSCVGFVSQGWVEWFSRYSSVAVREIEGVISDTEQRFYWNDDVYASPAKTAFIGYVSEKLGADIIAR